MIQVKLRVGFAAAAVFLGISGWITSATAQGEVLTQENEVGPVDWLPAISMLYVAHDHAMPVFEPGAQPEFPYDEEAPPGGEGGTEKPPADADQAPQPEDVLKSGPPMLTLIGGGPPVRDWKIYARQLKSDQHVSILASALRNGKPALWVHDATKAGYLLAYEVNQRLNLFFDIDLLVESFPPLDIPGGVARRDFLYENIKVVLGGLKLELLDTVTQQGSEGHVSGAPLYEQGFAGATLAEIARMGRAEFTPRLTTMVEKGVLDRVYRLSLEMELEAWGNLGFDEPSKRNVYAEIRFVVRDASFSSDQIGGESQGGSDPGTGQGESAGGAEPQ